MRRSGATWGTVQIIVEKQSITTEDLEIIIRWYGWRATCGNSGDIYRKYIDKRILHCIDPTNILMGMGQSEKADLSEENMAKHLRPDPLDEVPVESVSIHSIRHKLPNYLFEQVCNHANMDPDQVYGKMATYCVDEWVAAKAKQLDLHNKFQTSDENLVAIYRLWIHFERRKRVSLLKELTCFVGDQANAEKEIVATTPQPIALPTANLMQLSNALPNVNNQYMLAMILNSVNTLTQAVQAQQSKDTGNASNTFEGPPKTTQMKIEKVLQSELPLPTNSAGQPIEETLFWSSVPQLTKKENKNPIITRRRLSESDWQVVKAITAKEMFEQNPKLLGKIRDTIEYGLALEWLASFEGSEGFSSKLRPSFMDFPDCCYISDHLARIGNCIARYVGAFRVVLEIWKMCKIITIH